MWPFQKSTKRVKQHAETLEERMELLEASHRSLKTEWLDTYDKLYRLAGRLDAGRRWTSEKAPSPPTNEAEIAAPAPTEVHPEGVGSPQPGDGHPRTRRELLALMSK